MTDCLAYKRTATRAVLKVSVRRITAGSHAAPDRVPETMCLYDNLPEERVNQYDLPSRGLRDLRMSLRFMAFSLRFRMAEGFSKYSRFFHSRMMPSFSTMRLNRLMAFSSGSLSSTIIWLILNHLPSNAVSIVRMVGSLSRPTSASGSLATPLMRNSQCRCGPVARPVMPTVPRRYPRGTISP